MVKQVFFKLGKYKDLIKLLENKDEGKNVTKRGE